eukprot:gene11950-14115_t
MRPSSASRFSTADEGEEEPYSTSALVTVDEGEKARELEELKYSVFHAWRDVALYESDSDSSFDFESRSSLSDGDDFVPSVGADVSPSLGGKDRGAAGPAPVDQSTVNTLKVRYDDEGNVIMDHAAFSPGPDVCCSPALDIQSPGVQTLSPPPCNPPTAGPVMEGTLEEEEEAARRLSLREQHGALRQGPQGEEAGEVTSLISGASAAFSRVGSARRQGSAGKSPLGQAGPSSLPGPGMTQPTGPASTRLAPAAMQHAKAAKQAHKTRPAQHTPESVAAPPEAARPKLGKLGRASRINDDSLKVKFQSKEPAALMSDYKVGSDARQAEAAEREDTNVNWFRGFIPAPISTEDLEQRDAEKLARLRAALRGEDDGDSTALLSDQADSKEFGMSESDEEAEDDMEDDYLIAGSGSRGSSRPGSAASAQRRAARGGELAITVSAVGSHPPELDTPPSGSESGQLSSSRLEVAPSLESSQESLAPSRHPASDARWQLEPPPTPSPEPTTLPGMRSGPLLMQMQIPREAEGLSEEDSTRSFPLVSDMSELPDAKQVAFEEEDLDEERKRELAEALPMRTNTRVELALYFVLTFLLDTQRLSRALARYFLVLASVVFKSMGGIRRTLDMLQKANQRNRHTMHFLWETRVRGRNANWVFQEMESEAARKSELKLASLATEGAFQVESTHMDSLLLQMGYVLIFFGWGVLMMYLLTYSVAIADTMGKDEETAVLGNWVVFLIIDQFGIHVVKTLCIKVLVQKIMTKLQERAKGEAGLVTWYEMYIMTNLQTKYTLAGDELDTTGAMYDSGGATMMGMDLFTAQIVEEFNEAKRKPREKKGEAVDDILLGAKPALERRRIMALKIKCFAQMVRLKEELQDVHTTERLFSTLGLSLTSLQLCIPMDELREMSLAHRERSGRPSSAGGMREGSMLDTMGDKTSAGAMKQSRFKGSVSVDRSNLAAQRKLLMRCNKQNAENIKGSKIKDGDTCVERLMGTALVLAYLDVYRVISPAQLELQREKARPRDWALRASCLALGGCGQPRALLLHWGRLAARDSESMSEEELRQKKRDENRQFLQLVAASHPYVAIYYGRFTDTFSRAQRGLVLASSMLVMLFTTLYFSWNKGNNCCNSFKEWLGCEVGGTECWSYTTCQELYTAQEDKNFPRWMYSPPDSEATSTWNDPDDWVCTAFPSDTIMDKVYVMVYTLVMQLPPVLLLTTIFTLGNTPVIPAFWSKSKKYKKLMRGTQYVPDKGLNQRMWATILAVERYKRLPFGWTINPEDLPSEQRTLEEVAMQWVNANIKRLRVPQRVVDEAAEVANQLVDGWITD